MKPRLTAKAVANLRAVAGYATSEAELLLCDGTKDQQEHAEEVLAGTEWIFRLCNWYDDNHPTQENHHDT